MFHRYCYLLEFLTSGIIVSDFHLLRCLPSSLWVTYF